MDGKYGTYERGLSQAGSLSRFVSCGNQEGDLYEEDQGREVTPV